MDQETLVADLQERGVLGSDRVIAAFRSVPREAFVPEQHRDRAYVDRPLPIGHDQTISAPHMVAAMTELLDPGPDDRVLEIGTGSGYQAAILAELVDTVITTEIVPELAAAARDRLADRGNVSVVTTDGSIGYPAEAPYTRILYTAAVPALPDAIFDQLADGGRLVAPVGSGPGQDLLCYTKTDGEIARSHHGMVRFVPLRGEAGTEE